MTFAPVPWSKGLQNGSCQKNTKSFTKEVRQSEEKTYEVHPVEPTAPKDQTTFRNIFYRGEDCKKKKGPLQWIAELVKRTHSDLTEKEEADIYRLKYLTLPLDLLGRLPRARQGMALLNL